MNMRFLLILLVCSSLVFLSCDKDKSRTSLLGSWNCEEFPEQTLPRNYQVSILRNPYLANKTNEYKISNFYKWGLSETADVYFYQDTTSGKLIIPIQTVPINNYSVYGTGIVDENFTKISWEYYISSGTIDEKVMANYY